MLIWDIRPPQMDGDLALQHIRELTKREGVVPLFEIAATANVVVQSYT